MLARIAEVVHDILLATQRGNGGGKGASSKPLAIRPGGTVLQAGFSTPQMPPGTVQEHAWTFLEAHTFNVRCGPNYPKNGIKKPSKAAFGKIEAMDVFITERKLRHSMSLGHITLPPATPGWKEVYPEFLVITQMLPKYFNRALVTGKEADGITYMLTSYVRMPPNLAPGFGSHEEPQNAEQLMKRFLMRADQDPGVAHCWKMIGVVLNLTEVGPLLPRSVFRMLSKFNGKPILSRPQHEFFRDPQNRYLQADLDGHQYNYGTRTAVSNALHLSKHMEMGYGYVVESRQEAEMPEVMCCCSKILKFQLDRAVPFPPGTIIPN